MALALRLARIGMLEPDLDENYSVVMARWPAGVLRGALNDTNPPLYLYLLKMWMAAFGVEAGPVRALSTLFGVAQLAALGAWLGRLGLPRRAALWAMALGALAPLHVYYSQVARGYTLTWLLLTLALWSFCEGGEWTKWTQWTQWTKWTIHGVCLALGLYTHNLFVFVVPVFVVGAWVMSLPRREWVKMGVTYDAVGLVWLPWLIFTLRTVRGGSLGWIAETWSAAGAPGLLLGSLEALGTGAHFPETIRLVPPNEIVRWLGLVWLVVVVAGLRAGTPALPGKFLVLFVLGPLALMLGYSLIGTPIYVVGRYDTLALPAMLGLLGLGAWRLQESLGVPPSGGIPHRLKAELPNLFGGKWNVECGIKIAGILIMLAPLIVTGSIVGEKFRPLPPGVNIHPQAARGELLRDYLKPGDMVVCLGLEGVRIGYQMERLGLQAEWITFPLGTQSHLGYFLPREAVKDMERLRRDAAAILDRAAGRRLWVALDRYSFRPAEPGSIEWDYTAIATVLLEAIEARGMKEWTDPEFMARANKMGLRVYGQGT